MFSMLAISAQTQSTTQIIEIRTECVTVILLQHIYFCENESWWLETYSHYSGYRAYPDIVVMYSLRIHCFGKCF
jgi:hypothetical protein